MRPTIWHLFSLWYYTWSQNALGKHLTMTIVVEHVKTWKNKSKFAYSLKLFVNTKPTYRTLMVICGYSWRWKIWVTVHIPSWFLISNVLLMAYLMSQFFIILCFLLMILLFKRIPEHCVEMLSMSLMQEGCDVHCGENIS